MGLASITTDEPAAQAAAKWLRSSLELPECTSLVPYFEKEFNCCVTFPGVFRSGMIYFTTEQDLVWFLLKWS